jgi:CRISPR-associated protein Csb2
MEQYLCIAVTFLADHYHGREWPPGPARLFQALLAGANTGIYRQYWPQVEPVLRILERLPAPEMVARNSGVSSSYSIAVPNNDSDKVGREWSAGREFDAGKLRTMKAISPRRFQADGKANAHVYYLWPVSNSQISADAVRQLTSFLHTFGWGIDMAYADSFLFTSEDKQSLTAKPAYSHHKPANKGALQNVPAPGYLDDLTATYRQAIKRQSTQGVNPSIRALSYGQQRYVTSGQANVPNARFTLQNLEDSEKFYRIPWAFGMKVAAWMRHAAAEALRQEKYPDNFVNSYVLGHGNGHGNHMSFIPVPNIGFHADGAIRRVMVLEPPGCSGEIAALLQLKLSSAVLHELLENGSGPRKTRPVCQLFEARNDNIWPYYMRPSLHWRSVTPVVLHGHNSEHGKFSLKKTEQLLYQAFEKSGYSRQTIAELAFQPAPFWAGTEGALAMRVPEHLKKWPRYHVAVRFHQPVNGPLLVGIGRHYGVGLFAAAD